MTSVSILIYLWFRFELVFGVAAVIALLHDVVIALVLVSLWNVQVSLDVIAALMVLMGFSVNDTIVIFDRIRENTRLYPSKSFREICNLAMNQSLSRTILTSGTVFLVVLCLFFLGGEGLRPFAKVYLLGTVIGTYSTAFIAAPLLFTSGTSTRATACRWRWPRRRRKRKRPSRSAAPAPRPAPERKDPRWPLTGTGLS